MVVVAEEFDPWCRSAPASPKAAKNQSEHNLTERERGGVPGFTDFEQDSAMKSSTAADDCERLQLCLLFSAKSFVKNKSKHINDLDRTNQSLIITAEGARTKALPHRTSPSIGSGTTRSARPGRPVPIGSRRRNPGANR
jgi:hypothetical protein